MYKIVVYSFILKGIRRKFLAYFFGCILYACSSLEARLTHVDHFA